MAGHPDQRRASDVSPPGNLQRELDAALTDPHRLGLHELKGRHITMFGPGARYYI
ncbi:MAG: hypothetical protein AB7O44_28125 [Hyphomicrobiaceae bacterium]